MIEYNLINLIRGFMRVIVIFSIFIDVILINRFWFFLMFGMLDLGLSDYYLVYVVSRLYCFRICFIIVEKCIFKNYDFEWFCDDLYLILFDIVYIFEDIDDIYWVWSYLLLSLFDDYVLIKCKIVKWEYVLFMIFELFEVIRKWNKLKCFYNKFKCLLDWDRYKI